MATSDFDKLMKDGYRLMDEGEYSQALTKFDKAIKTLKSGYPLGNWQFFVKSQLQAQIGTIYYLKKDFDNTDLYGGVGTDAEIEYGYDLTLEVEPHFEKMIADGFRLGIGVPATLTMSPETKEDGTGQDDESYLLTVGPNVSLFLMNFFIPTELKVGYTLPLLGKNDDALNTIVFQVKTYMKF